MVSDLRHTPLAYEGNIILYLKKKKKRSDGFYFYNAYEYLSGSFEKF